MTDKLPNERDDELDEIAESDASVQDEPLTGETAGGEETQAVEAAMMAPAESASELPLDPLFGALAKPDLDREFQLPRPHEGQGASASDARWALDVAIAEIGARTAGVALPSTGDQLAIEHAFERRENFGTGRVEIAVGRPGEQAHPVKLSESSPYESTSFAGAAAPPTPTPPVGGKREELFRAPQVMLFVQLAEGRATYVKAIEEALDKNAPKYREIAEAEVKLGFWRYENQRRAADYRLRGPSW
jgi:hypothetical protein